MEYINTRTLARLAAVQGLYQYAMTNSNKAVIISKIINYYKNSEQVKKDFNIQVPIITKLNTFYFNKLLTSTFNNLITVDQIIQSNLSPDFKFDDLSLIVVAIVRVGISELQYEDIPYKVVINEFTNLANMLLPEHEVNFINSFLDKINLNI